ncbi:hypothetical protein FQV27_13040 [Paracoccus aurantiacus]|uniref:Uncharacterized protein n=1 Tax=Paracoccus aurantiacus TaxID=2599412 RepID=A0A5C6S1J4_9RHOB|nr:hypothetical protein [Paracoccus aurantiacus]TXB68105.1 hypothetical protein FQV27_13040 [Paracoccus aurantiacus]
MTARAHAGLAGLATVLTLAAMPVAAQSVGECGEWTSARNIAEPWEDHTATYAEGRVRIAVLDTVEPAAAAVHLMILSPPLDEIGGRQCRVISLDGRSDGGWPSGFLNIDFSGRSARYDEVDGLTLSLPVETYEASTGGADRALLSVTINQSTGEITAKVTAE